MNEYLSQNIWASPGFRDPFLWDTKLSEKGLALASLKNLNIKQSSQKLALLQEIQLIICMFKLFI